MLCTIIPQKHIPKGFTLADITALFNLKCRMYGWESTQENFGAFMHQISTGWRDIKGDWIWAKEKTPTCV